jgi:hypothetical protein
VKRYRKILAIGLAVALSGWGFGLAQVSTAASDSGQTQLEQAAAHYGGDLVPVQSGQGQGKGKKSGPRDGSGKKGSGAGGPRQDGTGPHGKGNGPGGGQGCPQG